MNNLLDNLKLCVLFGQFIELVKNEAPELALVKIITPQVTVWSVHEDYYELKSLEKDLDPWFFGKYTIENTGYYWDVTITTDIESRLHEVGVGGRLSEDELKSLNVYFREANSL